MPVAALAILDAATLPVFVEFGLPSLLAAGNLPALSDRLHLHIVGSGAVLAAIQRVPALAAVRARETRYAIRADADPALPQCWAAALADRRLRGLPVLRLDPRVFWAAEIGRAHV